MIHENTWPCGLLGKTLLTKISPVPEEDIDSQPSSSCSITHKLKALTKSDLSIIIATLNSSSLCQHYAVMLPPA